MPSSRQGRVSVEIAGNAPVEETSVNPQTDPVSYYKRNSGLLPHLTDTASGTYELGALPKPVDPGPDSLMERLSGLVGAIRNSRRLPR